MPTFTTTFPTTQELRIPAQAHGLKTTLPRDLGYIFETVAEPPTIVACFPAMTEEDVTPPFLIASYGFAFATNDLVFRFTRPFAGRLILTYPEETAEPCPGSPPPLGP
jgi:hypothetical protein